MIDSQSKDEQVLHSVSLSNDKGSEDGIALQDDLGDDEI